MASEGFLKGSGKDNSHRRYKGGGPRPDHNAYKREEAAEREAAWRKLSPTEQLADLDRRLGKGVGAKKQRDRIVAKAVEDAKKPAKAPEATSTKSPQKAKDRRAQERAERPSK